MVNVVLGYDNLEQYFKGEKYLEYSKHKGQLMRVYQQQ